MGLFKVQKMNEDGVTPTPDQPKHEWVLAKWCLTLDGQTIGVLDHQNNLIKFWSKKRELVQALKDNEMPDGALTDMLNDGYDSWGTAPLTRKTWNFQAQTDMNPHEAILAFCLWLDSRENKAVFGGGETQLIQMRDLVTRFAETNKLPPIGPAISQRYEDPPLTEYEKKWIEEKEDGFDI